MRDPAIQPEAIDAAAASIHPARGALAAELKALVADLEQLAHEATALGGEEFAEAKARIAARLAAARDGLAQAGDAVGAQVRAGAQATDHYVHEQPWKAIAVGATLGLLLGFALARR